MMLTATILTVVLGASGASDGPDTAEAIIQSYVEDFRSDRFAAAPMLFGIRVPNEGEWHVRVTGEQSGERWGVGKKSPRPHRARQ